MSKSSRERILAAINCEEPDHVPFVPSFIGPWVDEYWKGKGWMMDMLQLGLDQFVSLNAPSSFHPAVRVRMWKEHPTGSRYPLLFKVYETPAGDLRQVVNQTNDWPHGDDIPLLSDHVAAGGRSVEFLIKAPEDVEKLRYLLWRPTNEQVVDFHEEAKNAKALAEKHGLLIDAVGGYGGTYLLQLCGLHRLLVWTIKMPEVVIDMLEIVHEWDLKRVRLLLEEDPDMVTHDGWYENPVFWSVKGYKKMLEPLISEEIEMVHSTDAKFRYIMTMGLMPLADTLKKMGIDIIYGVDPTVERVSPEEIRSKFGHEICLWCGVNENVTFQQGSSEELRWAVVEAIRAFGPGGGYVLSTMGSILQKEGWERNGPVMIETWRKYGRYPIKR
jgi:hypothetical protein